MIKNWYCGTPKAYENDRDDSLQIIGMYVEYHWTAKIARLLVQFYLAHWQWIWSMAVALCSLSIAYFRFVA